LGTARGVQAGERRAPDPLDSGRARERGRERELGRAGLRLRAESEAPAHSGGEKSFSFYFSILFPDFQNAASLNQFLSNKMAFSGNGPKMKVA
jgi:hypothetical protein